MMIDEADGKILVRVHETHRKIRVAVHELPQPAAIRVAAHFFHVQIGMVFHHAHQKIGVMIHHAHTPVQGSTLAPTPCQGSGGGKQQGSRQQTEQDKPPFHTASPCMFSVQR